MAGVAARASFRLSSRDGARPPLSTAPRTSARFDWNGRPRNHKQTVDSDTLFGCFIFVTTIAFSI